MDWTYIFIFAGSAFGIIAPFLNFANFWSVGVTDDSGPQSRYEWVRLIVSIMLTFTMVGASLYIILSKQYDDGTTKWAFAMIGTVIGYWLSEKQGQVIRTQRAKEPSKRLKTK